MFVVSPCNIWYDQSDKNYTIRFSVLWRFDSCSRWVETLWILEKEMCRTNLWQRKQSQTKTKAQSQMNTQSDLWQECMELWTKRSIGRETTFCQPLKLLDPLSWLKYWNTTPSRQLQYSQLSKARSAEPVKTVIEDYLATALSTGPLLWREKYLSSMNILMSRLPVPVPSLKSSKSIMSIDWEYRWPSFREEKRLYPQIFVLREVDIIVPFYFPWSAYSNDIIMFTTRRTFIWRLSHIFYTCTAFQ